MLRQYQMVSAAMISGLCHLGSSSAPLVFISKRRFRHFEIGTPMFNNARVDVGNGKVFEIRANNVSRQNIFIQSATLNGEAFDQVI